MLPAVEFKKTCCHPQLVNDGHDDDEDDCQLVHYDYDDFSLGDGQGLMQWSSYSCTPASSPSS